MSRSLQRLVFNTPEYAAFKFREELGGATLTQTVTCEETDESSFSLCASQRIQGHSPETWERTIIISPHKAGTPVERVVPADCLNSGTKTVTTYCIRCNEKMSETTETLAALGHDWGAWVVTTQPTCETKGQETCTCNRDANHKQYRELAALGHNWDSGVITKQPDCTNPGVRTYTCQNDPAHTKTESIPVVTDAHKWDSGKVTKQPNCTEPGVKTYTCTINPSHTRTESIPIVPDAHVWDNGTVTKPSTCFENGIKTYICTVCGETKTEKINALEHAPVLHRNLPADKQAGGAYYQCENCGSYWAAVYDSEKEQYTIPDEEPAASLEEALAASDSLPAPYFNIFCDTDERVQYDYSTRGASLKYEYLKRPDYQPMRFSASVRVPEGVNDAIGAAGNAITDVGIIYSQTKLIEGLDAFTIGAENVYRMSVKSKNSAAVYDGSNWGGVTKHESADGTHLTFNLVVNVLPENWREEYCARAYITYNYCGFEYTVYDEAFSTRSVAYLAQKVVESPSETQAAKDYCQSEILDILEQL